MRLINLHPQWYRLEEHGPIFGVTFLCPHSGTVRLAMPFYPDAGVHMPRTLVQPSSTHLAPRQEDATTR